MVVEVERLTLGGSQGQCHFMWPLPPQLSHIMCALVLCVLVNAWNTAQYAMDAMSQCSAIMLICEGNMGFSLGRLLWGLLSTAS